MSESTAAIRLEQSEPSRSPKSSMYKTVTVVAAALLALAAYAQNPHDDKSVHHAAMHAEHWVSGHVNAPHRRFRHRYPNRYHHHDKSVHHAAMHAEHWMSSHVNAPHKH